MTAPPDPAAVAAAERDHAARLYAEHQAEWHAQDCPEDCADCGKRDCRVCASLAGHVERTARQAELLAPAQTGEMF